MRLAEIPVSGWSILVTGCFDKQAFNFMTTMLTLGRALIVCVIALIFGVFLIWRGATGDVMRSKFTGDVIIPGWMYIGTGAFVILLAMGWTAAAYFLGKM
jgi:hypothetical protein